MEKKITSEERIKITLQHSEPDRVPFDLGSTTITGINIDSYKKLLFYLGIEKKNFPVLYERSGIAEIHEDILIYLKVDTRGLFPNVYKPADWAKKRLENKDYWYIIDEMGVKWRMPKENGHYYDVAENPLKYASKKEDIDNYLWPDFTDSQKIDGLEEQAKRIQSETQCAIILEAPILNIFAFPPFLIGYENFFLNLASNPKFACYLMDKMLDFQLQYWEMALQKLMKYVLIVRMGDDLGTQSSTLISPSMYRKYVKPRHHKLFSSVKKMTKKKIYIFFHTDGSVYDIIPDLIEVGVDILNPIQYSAAKMDTKRLKNDFGRELTFWGGGIDTQDILPHKSPRQVKEEVKKKIDDLAPDGGFVFCPVHNIQYDVPPQNIIAMWEALQEYGRYL